MGDLGFEVIEARAEPHAAVPTLAFRLRLTSEGGPIDAIALRCQIRIEPQRRRYSPDEQERLLELFGEPPRWGETLKSLLWTHASVMVPGFEGSTEVELPIACSYDFEVAAAKYLHSLEGGEIPLILLFNGTVFAPSAQGFAVQHVPWEKEAKFRLPVATWRELMDLYFPNSTWVRLRRETFDALYRFKARRALPTWEDALEALLKQAGEGDLL